MLPHLTQMDHQLQEKQHQIDQHLLKCYQPLAPLFLGLPESIPFHKTLPKD